MKSEQAGGQSNDACEPLAIIGLAFEFPQTATSAETFWQLVHNGETTSSDFPTDRFNIDAFYHPDQDRPSTLPLRGGHFLKENLGAFDAPFFSITPSEAACMDPQHRHMLETSYHALEDAGIPLTECSGSNTAVYTGCFTNDYLSILHQDYEADQKHAAMGLVPSMMANRLSWFFNFKGTSMNLDSACSSSLVALHLACQDLRVGNADMALVGGANLVYHPNFMKTMSDFNFLSPDSHCWSFGERANGYARGEGIAIIVVKRLSDALRDNNTIRAIIRNTGSNQDGKTPGITQPSGDAQVNLIKDTYRRGNIDMGPTRFFQAHATGTAVGDPIEGNAIGRAFKGYREENDPLYVGAVKANIGHLEGCSGLAGVIITILVLEKGIIPPISGLELVNKRIDAEQLHLIFPREPIAWPDSPVRRACVNSFGFGGTNAVAILDDAYNYMRLKGIQGYHRTHRTANIVASPFSPTSTKCERSCQRFKTAKLEAVEPMPPEKYSAQLQTAVKRNPTNAHRVLVLSAPDKQGAERLNDLYHVYLKTRPDDFKFDDLAYAMITNRSQFSWRSFAIAKPNGCSPSREVIEFSKPIKSLKDPRIAFIFTGQGAQYLGMGRELVSFSVFRDSLATCGEYLETLGCGWSPLAILNSKSTEPDINSPEISQPLTTILQIALVDLLKSFGIVASVSIGHSSGEIAGAYASGALSKYSAVKVAYYRGLLSSQLASTRKDLSMMAVGLSRQEILPYLTRLDTSEDEFDVEIGCINSPNSITLTGISHQLAIIESYLKADAVFARMLRVPTAYHSRHMRSIAEQYAASIRDIENEKSPLENIPMISSVTGELIKAQDLLTARYWVLNLISSVEFEAAFTKLLTYSAKTPRRQLKKAPNSNIHSITHVLEVGPHGALQGPVRDIVTAHPGGRPRYIATLTRGEDASLSISKLVGYLHCAGFHINFSSIDGLNTTSRPIPPDMPHYPFNHSQRHWIESSLSRNFRFRDTPRHDLLGTRSIDWNPQMAIWRNVMRLSELLWLEDHKIGGIVVLPAAAILTMAVESYRQLHGISRFFNGVYISNTTFSHAVSFPSGVSKIETQFALMPSSYTVDLQPTSEFRLFLLENGSYIECARGFIRGIRDETDKNAVVAAGPWKPRDTLGTWIRKIEESCFKHTESPYRELAGTELQYGPSFQNLSGVTVGAHGQVSAVVATNTWRVENMAWPAAPFVLHPATLDGIFQSSLYSHLAKRPDGLPTMMPVRVAGLYIDSCVSELNDDPIRISAKPSTHIHNDSSTDIVGTCYHTGLPLVYVVGLETATISDVRSSRTKADKTRRLCTRLVWKEDIDTMTQRDILQYCTHERPKQQPNAVEAYRLQKVAIMCFVEEALSFLDENPSLELEGHLEWYVGWMRIQKELLARSDPESSLLKASVQTLLADPHERQRVNHEVKCAPGDGFFFIEIGEHLIDILRGEVDPLDLMFRDGLADRYYEEMLGNEHHAYPVAQFLDLLCFKNPSMKILEVGAGTGGQTTRVLDAMNHNGVRKWEQYDYTDISAGFFAAAKDKFASHIGYMNFRLCDISKDPTSQGFEEYSYDLVIASHVLHATSNLRDSLRNVRRLLKPNGKFLLFETTRPEAIPIGFAFGILQGWWEPLRFEARSTHSPCVSVDCWDSLLKETGFAGVDVDIPGQQEPYCRSASILLSTAVGGDSKVFSSATHVYIVVNDQVEAQVSIAAALRSNIQETITLASEIRTLTELSNQKISEPSLTIFLSEIDDVLIDEISSNDYETLQSALVRAKNILWVTRTEPLSETQPKLQLSTGLGRSLMSEDSIRKFVHLDLTHCKRVLEDEVHFIHELAEGILNLPVECIENDYVVLQNKLHICRLTEYVEMDEKIAQAVSPRQNREIQPTHETRLELFSPGPNAGPVEWRELERDECHDGCPDLEDVVRIQVQAVGLTFRDYLAVKGQLKATSLGNECAGVVIQSGSQSAFKPGDQVCFISSSGACSVVDIRSRALIKIPQTLSLVSAVSMCTAQWIAYYALVRLAHLQQGEIVLIHQGSSCVGQMAIQLARNFSCRVLVTVGSANRAKFLHDECSIPEDDMFRIDDPMLLYNIRQSTKQQGVDVVIGAILDSAKEYGSDLLACLGPCGRLVDTSLLIPATAVQNSIFKGLSWNTSTSTINMAGLIQKKPDLFYATFQSALRLAFDEHFKPPRSIRTFAPGEVNLAFDTFEKREEICKRVITLDLHLTVPASIKTKSTYQFHKNATYIIGGGLGGIGRSVARWMASRGARNLILPSRSGVSTDTSKLFVNELEKQGVCIATPKVDLADYRELESVLQGLTKVMPPIRGCIQCATVLRDNLFANMSYDDWCISVKSKANGSWNLHSTLPNGLDFFIMLASVNGIFGGRAQANYAAANAFQDALAHYRVSLGEKAISIDLGLMIGEGIVAEDVELLSALRRWGQFMDVEQNELIALLDHYCNPGLSLSPQNQAQIVIGVETAAAIRAKGIDIHHSFYRPLFRQLFRMDVPEADGSHGAEIRIDYATALRQVSSDDAAGELITTWLKTKIAQTLNLQQIDVDEEKPIHVYGIDSLVAIDLKNWFTKEVGAEIQVFILLGNKPLREVAFEAAQCSKFR